LTATTSKLEPFWRAARYTLRPIRPKPLMPTFTVIVFLPANSGNSVASLPLPSPPAAAAIEIRGDEQAAEPIGHGRPAAAGAACEAIEAVARMALTEDGGLAQRRRQRLPALLVVAEPADRPGLEN